MGINRTQELQDRIRAALNDKTMLRIVGGNSKNFYGNDVSKNNKVEIIETRIHQVLLVMNQANSLLLPEQVHR